MVDTLLLLLLLIAGTVQLLLLLMMYDAMMMMIAGTVQLLLLLLLLLLLRVALLLMALAQTLVLSHPWQHALPVVVHPSAPRTCQLTHNHKAESCLVVLPVGCILRAALAGEASRAAQATFCLGLRQAYHRPMTAIGESLRSLRKPLPEPLTAHASKGRDAMHSCSWVIMLGRSFVSFHMLIGIAAW